VNHTGNVSPIVELRNVSKVYAQGDLKVTALQEVNLALHKGEYVVIMGPSGSGKSTLLNLLGCLDRVSAGSFLLDGEDVSRLNDFSLSGVRSRKLGFIFQSYNLIQQLNVLENIEIPLYYQDVEEREARRRAREQAVRLGLEERLEHKPFELSGGQQQRVAIARALVTNPVLLLADEPTGNLDSKTGAEILDVVERLNAEGKTLVVVTHDDAIARRAHRVIRLRDGRIVLDERNGAKQT
jgi:putative ABC transport system ATP-binding protein